MAKAPTAEEPPLTKIGSFVDGLAGDQGCGVPRTRNSARAAVVAASGIVAASSKLVWEGR